MRSSRRNLGLQPELIPDDSDSNVEGEDSVEPPEVEERESHQSDTVDEPAQLRAASSDDVNLDDSNLSRITSDSETEDEVVAVTS